MFDIDHEKVKQIISSFQIPVKPQILTELQQEQSRPEPCPNAYAEIVAKDVALSANILKTINSPLFGLNRAISDIKQSVMMLGTDNVTNIASFFQLRQAFSGKSAISHEKYWDTAMETANMIGIILDHMDFKNDCPTEDAYAFGLFRDCGIPLMAMKFPDYKDVLMEANANYDTVFTEIEDQHYSTNHAVVGYFVANSWNLPKDLCQLILRHHQSDFLEASDATEEQKNLFILAKMASNALNNYKFMKDDSEWYLVQESVRGYLGLSQHDYRDLEDDVKEEYKVQFS